MFTSNIWRKNEDPLKYVSNLNKKEFYKNTYVHMINLVNHADLWLKTRLNPLSMPTDRAKPGRPKKLRRVEHDEVVPRRVT